MRMRTLYAVIAFLFLPLGIWWKTEALWGVLLFGYLSRRAEKKEHEKLLEEEIKKN